MINNITNWIILMYLYKALFTKLVNNCLNDKWHGRLYHFRQTGRVQLGIVYDTSNTLHFAPGRI